MRTRATFAAPRKRPRRIARKLEDRYGYRHHGPHVEAATLLLWGLGYLDAPSPRLYRTQEVTITVDGEPLGPTLSLEEILDEADPLDLTPADDDGILTLEKLRRGVEIFLADAKGSEYT